MRYQAKEKHSEHPRATKSKLNGAQEIQTNTKTVHPQYNMNPPSKRKYIENNKAILPFLGNENPVHVCPSLKL